MSTQVKVLTAADLHRSQKLYGLLAKAVESHKPDVVALVGDFLDATGEMEGKLTVDDCARALSRLPCPETVFIRGNHEDSAWWAFAEEWRQSGRELHLLEGSCFAYGPLVMVGFPCLMLHGTGIGADLTANPDKWLPKVLRPHLPAARALWLMHEPPLNDQTVIHTLTLHLPPSRVQPKMKLFSACLPASCPSSFLPVKRKDLNSYENSI